MTGQTETKTVTGSRTPVRSTGPRPAGPSRNDERSPSGAPKDASGARGVEDKRMLDNGVAPVQPAKTAEETENTSELANTIVRGARRRSLRRELNDYVMPKVTDPSILHASSLINILEDFAVNHLPKLEGTQELRALAETVIKDEIARARAFVNRRDQGIAA